MADCPLIAVCGPIGSGKSTVVAGLAEELGFRAWPERVDQNPFFARYMGERAQWALRSQLSFMLLAVEDAANARSQPPGGVLERPVQEMFGVFVTHLHGQGLLDDDELLTLSRVVELGERLAGVPDLVIVLHGEPSRMLGRVRMRGRAGEEAYDVDEMQDLEAAYQAWRASWNRSPLIDVDTNAKDLRQTDEIELLAVQVRNALGIAE